MSIARPQASHRKRVGIVAASLLSVALVGSGGYVAACALAPLPEPQFELAIDGSATVTASSDAAQALVDAQPLPTAIGWLEGDEVWSNDKAVYPLGSITKLIMVLVCVQAKPLDPGADGDTYVWTAEDASRTDEYIAIDGVAYRIPVGAELTQRDMLKLIFLPSANDVAYSYALWTFGSNEAFIAAFESWKAQHGLDSITLIESTGLEVEDQASAADIVRVARLALENPAIVEFTSTQSAEMPWGIGTIENSNPLLGTMPGIIGLKTGTIYSNYNFVAAQRSEVDGREITHIAVTFARPSPEARAETSAAVLSEMARLPQPVTVLEAGEVVGRLTSADGQVAHLVTEASATAALLPGERATWHLSHDHASVIMQTPSGEVAVPVSSPDEFTEPDLWWRLTNPGLLFG